MTEMTREELEEAIKEDQVKQTNRVLRWVIVMVVGGCASILTGGIAAGNLSRMVSYQGVEIELLQPKVVSLENWREKIEATRVTPQEAAALDKRLQRVEDQNIAIMEALKKIDSKLP